MAVVDRTADITSAAEAVVASSFGFGCQSPYAPDIVLVNEFVKEAFLQALMKDAVAFQPNLTPLSANQIGDAGLSKKDQEDKGTRVVSSIGRATIVETHKLYGLQTA